MSAFITNNKQHTSLQKRLIDLIAHSKELKFLVGYFYFSGWQPLVEALQANPEAELKLLVGLEVEQWLGKPLEVATTSSEDSSAEIAEAFFASLPKAINTQLADTETFYTQVSFFVELLEQNRLHIRKTLEPNHAKLYIFNIKHALQGIVQSKFITGSSNLTQSGLEGQHEFNVEIGDYGTQEAEAYFDKLWKTAVPITEEPHQKKRLLHFMKEESQAAEVTPFEAYVLVLKLYLDLLPQQSLPAHIETLLEKKGYKNYAYQQDAVTQALTVLANYNGVIIADVVGLGKSVIAGMIAKSLGKRGLIIAPPGLIGDKNGDSGWQKYINDFELHDWEVRSSGDLEKTVAYVQNQGQSIEVIVVDEAHRFRNEDTENYERLSVICKNRQVVLLTATPFNNSPADIFALLKLFIVPKKSAITLDENLEAQFSHYQTMFRKLSFILKNYQSTQPKKRDQAERYYNELFNQLPVNPARVNEESKKLATEIRHIIEPVLIRRNRIDLKNDPVYSTEVTELSEVRDPEEQFFELRPEQSAFYDTVVNDYFGEYGRFTGAIYQPYMYEQGLVIEPQLQTDVEEPELDKEGNRAVLQQRNLFGFMRRLLVKRFESSFGAFEKSIANFIRVYERVQTFIQTSGGRYILDRKLIEKIYNAAEEEILQALENIASSSEETKRPKNEKVYQVETFVQSSLFLDHIQSDLTLMQSIQQEMAQLGLIQQDPKAQKLISTIQALPQQEEPRRKVIIFSEYVDTVRYLKPLLEEAFPQRVLTVEGNITKKLDQEILANFDARHPLNEQKNQYDIILTSDTLAEGFNLNRAGLIINYDIPWNPTRVIQRVGRINRIGKKMFEALYIYNFFPTLQGADIVKSRQIAGQKMFLIHNTLGEDAKIFESDEAPSASELFSRVNQNPEANQDESFITTIRRRFAEIEQAHPALVKNLERFPARIKTAKAYQQSQLIVCQRKGLGIFIQQTEPNTTDNKIKPVSLHLQEALPLIACTLDEPRLPLSSHFWVQYEVVKKYRPKHREGTNTNSLESKALSNLNTAINSNHPDVVPYRLLLTSLVKDLKYYRTLSTYTLRRLSVIDWKETNTSKWLPELEELQFYFGTFLGRSTQKDKQSILSEIIISIENQVCAIIAHTA
jgi:superfamily II DNA or RNA helicase/HKD family nuclease